jgi:hypothetical protein
MVILQREVQETTENKEWLGCFRRGLQMDNFLIDVQSEQLELARSEAKQQEELQLVSHQ